MTEAPFRVVVDGFRMMIWATLVRDLEVLRKYFGDIVVVEVYNLFLFRLG